MKIRNTLLSLFTALSIAQSTNAADLDVADLEYAFGSSQALSSDITLLSQEEMINTEGEDIFIILGTIGALFTISTVADIHDSPLIWYYSSRAGEIGAIGGILHSLNYKTAMATLNKAKNNSFNGRFYRNRTSAENAYRWYGPSNRGGAR